MNDQTPTQNLTKFAKARSFTGRHRTLVIAGAAGALLLGGGTAAAFAADDDPFESANSGGDQSGTSTDPTTGDDHGGDWDDAWDDHGDDDFVLPDAAIGEDAAVEAALAEIDGTVREVDLEGSADFPVWVIDITDADGIEWDVAVNALDGSILGTHQDDDSDDSDDDDHDDDDNDDHSGDRHDDDDDDRDDD